MSFLLLNDEQIIERFAESCRKKRLLLNMTQNTLARRANLSIATIKKFEGGGAASFRTIINILRAIGEIDRLQNLIPEGHESPREQFFREQKTRQMRQRASSEES